MGIAAQRLGIEFADELPRASTLANAAVAKSLFEMATRDRIPAAAICWARARMGWRDDVAAFLREWGAAPATTTPSCRDRDPEGVCGAIGKRRGKADDQIIAALATHQALVAAEQAHLAAGRRAQAPNANLDFARRV